MVSSDRLHVIDHPLVAHKLGILRDCDTSCTKFRNLVSELTTILAVEATRNVEVQDKPITTPVAPCVAKEVARGATVVSILRAGNGMLDGMLQLMPYAHVGFLGMYRNEETHKPVHYYQKLPASIVEDEVFLVDPMLATGGSSIDAITELRRLGVRRLTFLCMIAAPEGVEAVLAADPDVSIYTCAFDDHLNENAYIVPGVGDAGDRIFNTLNVL